MKIYYVNIYKKSTRIWRRFCWWETPWASWWMYLRCECVWDGRGGSSTPWVTLTKGMFAAVCGGVWRIEFVMLSVVMLFSVSLTVARCKNHSGNILFVITKTLPATSKINLSFTFKLSDEGRGWRKAVARSPFCAPRCWFVRQFL